jgi:tRNA(Ile)-lysidine synthetase-like protein
LPVPGVLCIAGLGIQVSVDRLPVSQAGLAEGRPAAFAGGAMAVVDAETAGDALAVRFRRPGDRIRPLGMSGHRKLQDLLVDRKVPREARDRVPLVVDAHDRIVWVAGHVISADVRVTSGTTRVLLLQLQRSGGVV